MITLGMRKGACALGGALLLTLSLNAQGPYPPPLFPPGSPSAARLALPETAGSSSAVANGQIAPTPGHSAFEDNFGFLIQLTPPGPERLFQFESEAVLRDRIREEWKHFKKAEFPPTSEMTAEPMQPPRLWPMLFASAEPNYVCYKRLWFEQRGSERYGYSYGVLQPFICTGLFYSDLALLPLHWMGNPLRWYECSAGQCLPGSTVPLLWNPLLPK
jgi:hypothetical protein